MTCTIIMIILKGYKVAVIIQFIVIYNITYINFPILVRADNLVYGVSCIHFLLFSINTEILILEFICVLFKFLRNFVIMITLICNCGSPQPTVIKLYTILKDLGPFFIALFVAYIAWQQYIINSRKLRLELFEKRYTVYKQVKDFIQKSIRDKGIEEITVIQNYTEINEGVFLFGKEIVDFINRITLMNVELMTFRNKLGNKNITEENKNIEVKMQTTIINKLISEYPHVEELFNKYLDFKVVKISNWNIFRKLSKFS